MTIDSDDCDELLAELSVRSGLAVAGLDELGLGPGPHPIAFFSLARMTEAAIDRVLEDHFGDDFLDVVPEAFARDPGSRRWRWHRDGLEPVAIVGVSDTFELGPALDDALPAAAVLLLDRRSSPASILAWNRNPSHRLLAIAPALADLDVRTRA